MIHHVSFGTNDAVKAKKFYLPILEIAGLNLMSERNGSLDFGSGALIFSLERPTNGKIATSGNGSHIAFAVEFRNDVDLFYKLGLENGGTDGGAPGLRPEYDANYYGAFLFDPDGNKIETVTFSSK
jgi:catechol 2,3-dioxygenase-like lactoylglutathione lyase family enzyme